MTVVAVSRRRAVARLRAASVCRGGRVVRVIVLSAGRVECVPRGEQLVLGRRDRRPREPSRRTASRSTPPRRRRSPLFSSRYRVCFAWGGAAPAGSARRRAGWEGGHGPGQGLGSVCSGAGGRRMTGRPAVCVARRPAEAPRPAIGDRTLRDAQICPVADSAAA